MLVLRKKQIIMATLFASLSIFTFMFTTAKEQVKETVSLPVSGKTVVLDARTSEYLMKVLKAVMELQKLNLI